MNAIVSPSRTAQCGMDRSCVPTTQRGGGVVEGKLEPGPSRGVATVRVGQLPFRRIGIPGLLKQGCPGLYRRLARDTVEGWVFLTRCSKLGWGVAAGFGVRRSRRVAEACAARQDRVVGCAPVDLEGTHASV